MFGFVVEVRVCSMFVMFMMVVFFFGFIMVVMSVV